jgi:hypothetical protein
MGRLKPGVTVVQARDDANRVAPDIYFSVRFPETRERYKGDLIPTSLKEYVTGKLHRSLISLCSAVGIILLIACVNLSNLLLARASARAREFAVRGALGASRGRIVRQLLLESVVLSCAGALCGLGLAVVLLAWLAHQTSIALPLLSTQHTTGLNFCPSLANWFASQNTYSPTEEPAGVEHLQGRVVYVFSAEILQNFCSLGSGKRPFPADAETDEATQTG